jgi:periplasmic divalent cation tolerance protein
MKPTRSHVVALVTAPDLKTARKIAAAVLNARAAACVNIVPRVESHYWWKGRIERGGELLLVIKTLKSAVEKLEKTVLANHPYDTPEFVVFALSGGNERYLRWLDESARPDA